jgi:hypothetical protein
MDNKVFLSLGSTANAEQQQFVDGIKELLTISGLSPRIMNENEWSHEQPLKAIKKIIKECKGMVIIAFTRVEIEKGYEIKRSGILDIAQLKLPTTWNHIEGAIAYSFGMPLLVIAEDGLKKEGLIDMGYDWTVCWTDVKADSVKTDKIKGFIKSWKNEVDQFSKTDTESRIDSSDPENIKLGSLIKSMTLPQIWKTISAVLIVLAAVATASYNIGHNQSKQENGTATSASPKT